MELLDYAKGWKNVEGRFTEQSLIAEACLHNMRALMPYVLNHFKMVSSLYTQYYCTV